MLRSPWKYPRIDAVIHITNSVGAITRMAYSAPEWLVAAHIRSAPKNIISEQVSPMDPNTAAQVRNTLSASRRRPRSAAAATSFDTATGSPEVETVKSMAYMEYAALNIPMYEPRMLASGILNNTPTSLTAKFETDIIAASATKLFPDEAEPDRFFSSISILHEFTQYRI